MRTISIITLVFLLLIGCKSQSRIVIQPSDQSSVGYPTVKGVSMVRVVYDIQGYNGSIRPDRVAVDGYSIQENTKIPVGSHLFTIEKKGYQKYEARMEVEGDDEFRLSVVLKAKARLIIFNIIDANTEEDIKPDRVSVARVSATGKGVPKEITNKSFKLKNT